MKTIEHYTAYGEEWKKEMSKLPKAMIIEIAAKIGQDKEELESRLPKKSLLNENPCKSIKPSEGGNCKF